MPWMSHIYRCWKLKHVSDTVKGFSRWYVLPPFLPSHPIQNLCPIGLVLVSCCSGTNKLRYQLRRNLVLGLNPWCNLWMNLATELALGQFLRNGGGTCNAQSRAMKVPVRPTPAEQCTTTGWWWLVTPPSPLLDWPSPIDSWQVRTKSISVWWFCGTPWSGQEWNWK